MRPEEVLLLGAGVGGGVSCFCFCFFPELSGKRTGIVDSTTTYLSMKTEQKVYPGSCPVAQGPVGMETVVFAEHVMSGTISFLLHVFAFIKLPNHKSQFSL